MNTHYNSGFMLGIFLNFLLLNWVWKQATRSDESGEGFEKNGKIKNLKFFNDFLRNRLTMQAIQEVWWLFFFG